MDWAVVLTAVAVAAGVFILRSVSAVSPAKTRNMLEHGGVVVDVRNRDEFSAGNLPGALNLPLSELENLAAAKLPDKSQPILVHCLSGGRSALARRKLKKLGYTQVENLGSFSRAAKLLKINLKNQPGT